MKKFYLVTISVLVIALLYLLIERNEKQEFAQNNMYDDEYLIYPSSQDGKYTLSLGSEEFDLNATQIGVFLQDGYITDDTTLVIQPRCEYQLTMEEEHIVIEDFGRTVAKVSYEKAGDIGKQLLKENE